MATGRSVAWQQPDASTGRSILGDLIQKIRVGAEGVFSSGTSASELEALIEHALRERLG